MDSGFETALDTCLQNAANASEAEDVAVTEKKQAKEQKVD